MKLSSVMSSKVATASPGTTLLTVSRMMSQKKISCVIITDKGKPLGIISERDIVRHFADNGTELTGIKASHVMSTPVETLWSNTNLDRAVALMGEKGFRRFPILKGDGKLAGIVTQSDVLNAFIREVEISHEKMKDLAIRDYLTGMYNRRFFMGSLEKEFYRSRRYETPMSLIILDLDNFKEINDRHGHQHGDQVLMTVASVIRRESRDSDIPARFGGEEFIVLAPETEMDQGIKLARRLLKKIAETGITASLGLTGYPNLKSRFPDDLIRLADEALYEAKRRGKNQVVSTADEFTEAENATG